jgi:hypothetical protein
MNKGMHQPTPRELDHQLLYLGVLETLRPELAETIRLESALADKPVEIVVVGDVSPDHPSVKHLAGEATLGKIVVSGELDSGAMMAAGVIVDELDELYRRVTKGRTTLERGVLFHELLGEMSPRLAEVFELEISLAGEDVDVSFDSDDEPTLGTVNLGDGDDSELVRAVAGVADKLYHLLDGALVEVTPEPAPAGGLRGWLNRLRRR